jgi:membrane protease YdiL (CAAX protease family)
MAALELAVAAGVLAFGLAGRLPFNATPVLFLVAWAWLWLRGQGWRGVGLHRPSSWPLTGAVGVGTGILYQAASLEVVEPLLARLTGELPDLTALTVLEGSPRYLLLALAVTWTVAAFGEEMVYRGYLMTRMAELAGGGTAAWTASLLLVSVVFGFGHLYQGASGVATTALAGLVTGALYLATGRNLWAAILAHGTMDTVGFLLLYLGLYPGQ